MVFKARGWAVFGLVLLLIILYSIWELFVEDDKALAMAKRNLPAMECHRDECNHGQNLGGR